jgi:hypothetical protein
MRVGWATVKKHQAKLVTVAVLALLIFAARTVPLAKKEGYIYDRNYDNCAEYGTDSQYRVIQGHLKQYTEDHWVPAPKPAAANLSPRQINPCGDGHLYITKQLYLL